MPRVTPRSKYETFESMLNRFKRAVEKADTMNDFYKHEFYEKPSKKRARKKAAAVKRQQRLVRESMINRRVA